MTGPPAKSVLYNFLGIFKLFSFSYFCYFQSWIPHCDDLSSLCHAVHEFGSKSWRGLLSLNLVCCEKFSTFLSLLLVHLLTRLLLCDLACQACWPKLCFDLENQQPSSPFFYTKKSPFIGRPFKQKKNNKFFPPLSIGFIIRP